MQSRNIIMFISLFILKQLYSNVLFCLFCYEVSWKWLSIFIIFNFYQKHYDHCHIQKVFLSKNKDILGNKKPKTNFLQWFKFGIYLSIFIRLIASAKNLEHLTIQLLWVTVGLLVARFTVQSTQWMKEMRTWGWSRFHLIVFLFGMNQVHCSSLNSRVQGKYLNCIVSAKIAKLWGEYLTIQLYGQQPDCW